MAFNADGFSYEMPWRKNYEGRAALGYLAGIVIIGRAYFHFGIFMKHHLAFDLFIHLCTPVVLTALGYADLVGLFSFTSRHGNNE